MILQHNEIEVQANLEQKPEPVCRVLVADDEASMREFATHALMYNGYEAEAVESGMAALAALRAEHYDLVLTDFNMPNGSGTDLIIKMHSEGIILPVIMMTGSELTKELVTLTAMLHVETILQKPFGIDVLLAAVKNAWRPGNENSMDLTQDLPVRGSEEMPTRYRNHQRKHW
jgi:DNA-binding NtrC family response regulator